MLGERPLLREPGRAAPVNRGPAWGTRSGAVSGAPRRSGHRLRMPRGDTPRLAARSPHHPLRARSDPPHPGVGGGRKRLSAGSIGRRRPSRRADRGPRGADRGRAAIGRGRRGADRGPHRADDGRSMTDRGRRGAGRGRSVVGHGRRGGDRGCPAAHPERRTAVRAPNGVRGRAHEWRGTPHSVRGSSRLARRTPRSGRYRQRLRSPRCPTRLRIRSSAPGASSPTEASCSHTRGRRRPLSLGTHTVRIALGPCAYGCERGPTGSPCRRRLRCRQRCSPGSHVGSGRAARAAATVVAHNPTTMGHAPPCCIRGTSAGGPP